MNPFLQRLAKDASLRDEFVAYLDERIAHESSIDRIDGTHPLEHQRGVVASLRRLREQTVAFDRHKEPA